MKPSFAQSVLPRAAALALLALPFAARAQTTEYLWPNGAPGAKGTADADKPRLYEYPAQDAKRNGAAIVICPGGGYSGLAIEYEGKEIAKWMSSMGVTAFVLQYRLGPAYNHPIEMNDAQRAMRWARANSKRFGIDVNRVGIMGFSAGGHLASTVATHYDSGAPGAADTVDRQSCRPDFQILGYPVITMDSTFTHMGSRQNLLGPNPSPSLVTFMSNEKQVTSKTPRAFIFHAKDDNVVPIKNSQSYYDALLKAGVPAMFKILDRGGHGFGMADGVNGAPKDTVAAAWVPLCAKWMADQGLFQKATGLNPTESGKPPRHSRTAGASQALLEEAASRIPIWNCGWGPEFFDAAGREH